MKWHVFISKCFFFFANYAGFFFLPTSISMGCCLKMSRIKSGPFRGKNIDYAFFPATNQLKCEQSKCDVTQIKPGPFNIQEISRKGNCFRTRKKRIGKIKRGNTWLLAPLTPRLVKGKAGSFIVLNIDWAIQTFDKVEPKPRSETQN